MDPALNTLARRPALLRVVTVVLALLLVVAALVLHTALLPAAVYSGLPLLALVLALALFNARKKLPFLPLARASTWLQIHIYAGWLCILLFFLHTGARWPDGVLERLLALVFVITAISGVFGIYISRIIPSRMSRSGEPLTFERIPEHRATIRRSVEALVRQAEKEGESTTLGDFYVQHLHAYLHEKPSWLNPLVSGIGSYRAILRHLAALERFLNPKELEFVGRLREWIETKRNLDYQFAGQRMLKVWLFVHIPATYSLILLGLAHGCIALLYAHS